MTEGGEASALAEASRGTSQGPRARHFREALVVAEVMLACTLLFASALLVRSFRAVLDVELGFDPANTVAWQLNPSADFPSHIAESAFYAALTDRVAEVPGIESVGLVDALPLGRNRSWGFSVVGVPEEDDTDDQIFPHIVDPGYLEAMRIPLVAGRNISSDDHGDAPHVVLMNESGARRVFPGEDALGKRIRLWGPWEWEVVGIAKDVRHVSPEMGPGIEFYLPLAQMADFTTMDLVVRSQLPVEQVAAAVGAAIGEVDASMPTGEFWTIRSTVERALSARRFTLAVLQALGLAALVLAGPGIYGVLAQSVAERTHEIGIRMALGASPGQLVASVLGRTLALAGAGTAMGAALSFAGGRLLDSLLYGVAATDPWALGSAAVVLLGVAAVAGTAPAVKAARLGGRRALTSY